MTGYWLVAAFFAATHNGSAQTNLIAHDVKALLGRDSRFGIFTRFARITPPDRCRRSGWPIRRRTARSPSSEARSRPPISSNTWRPKCRRSSRPIIPRRTLRGADGFDLEIGFADGRKQIQRYRISVSIAAAKASSPKFSHEFLVFVGDCRALSPLQSMCHSLRHSANCNFGVRGRAGIGGSPLSKLARRQMGNPAAFGLAFAQRIGWRAKRPLSPAARIQQELFDFVDETAFL